MDKVNSFDIMKELSSRNMGIKMFPADNLQDVRAGKGGWGSIKMAIDNGTASELMRRIAGNQSMMVCLLVIDPDDFNTMRAILNGDAGNAGKEGE